jgi:hypothetical protein
MDVETKRALLEARQLALVGERRRQTLAWLTQLETTGEPALVEAAVAALGFREREWDGDRLVVVDAGERSRVDLDPKALARLVRARADAGWSFADVRPMVRPGAALVPERYELLGKVTALTGELPEIVVDSHVQAGTTIAFEVDSSYREWIIEGALGYVGAPAPEVGAPVWKVVGPRGAR